MIDDAAYLGHMINDCGSLHSAVGMAEYALATVAHVNVAHVQVEGCHYATVTTRCVERGEELFASYGARYWLTRAGLSVQDVDDAEAAFGAEVRAGGDLCRRLEAGMRERELADAARERDHARHAAADARDDGA